MVIMRMVLLGALALLAGACATSRRPAQREMALVIAAAAGSGDGVARNPILGHLTTLATIRGQSDAGRAIDVWQGAAAKERDVGDLYSELARRLLQLRECGDGELFLYWAGPVFVRGTAGADVCLGRDGVAVSLMALRELLAIAPGARMFVVVDGVGDEASLGVLAASFTADGPITLWLTGQDVSKSVGSDTWAKRFRVHLESDAPESWTTMFGSLDSDRRLKQYGAEPRGFAWLWSKADASRPTPAAAPSTDPQPAPAVEPAPTSPPARAPDAKPEGAAGGG